MISAQVPGVDVQDLFVDSEVLGIWRVQVVEWVIDDGSCDPQQVCILPCRFCLKRQICEPVSGRRYLWVSAKPDSVPQRVVLLPRMSHSVVSARNPLPSNGISSRLR